MGVWEKINSRFEKIPTGTLNLLTVVSVFISIVSPIVGTVGVIKFYPENKAIIFIFVTTVIGLLAVLGLELRYMVKYKKLLLGTRKVSTNNFHSLTRTFRNTFFDILSYQKKGKLTVELLTVTMESFIKQALDDICQIYKEYTCQEISACVKYIDSVEAVDRDTASIRTFVRSSNTSSDRSENDNNGESIKIIDNSDFYSILSPNSANKKSYFYQRDLVKYAKDTVKSGDRYNNSTRDWERYYKATIVVPISIANKRLFFSQKKQCYDVIGFLCVDSLSTDAFLERDERYNIDIARAFAAELYVALSQYRHYLSKLTAMKGKNND